MRVVTFIILLFILAFLIHIANQLRKGKTIIFVFGKDIQPLAPIQVSMLPAVVSEVVPQVQKMVDTTYLKNITG